MSLEGHFCWEDCDEGPHGCVCGNGCPPPGQEARDDERERIISDARAVVEYMALHVDAQEDARKITLALDLLNRKHPEADAARDDERDALCPQPCVHLSAEDSREGKKCPEHPCTCQAALGVPVGEGEQQ